MTSNFLADPQYIQKNQWNRSLVESYRFGNQMPQLPSGRHIAIHAGPFEHFMQKVSEFALMREIVQMETISDVLDFVDVIFLVKSDLESNHSSEYSLADESFTPPPGFIALNSGFKLPDWEGMAKDWSAEDRAAMQDF